MSHGSPVTKYKYKRAPRWSATFDIGVEEIDTAHRRLFAIVNEAHDALKSGDRAIFRRCVETFIQAAEKHFSEEEEFLTRVGYSETQKHKAYHAMLLDKAKRLKETCDGDVEDAVIEACYADVLAFLMDDIVRGDQKFKSYLDHLGLTR